MRQILLIGVLTLLSLAASAAEAEKKAFRRVIGDTFGGDRILRRAAVQWSAEHADEIELRTIAPETAAAPDNGCDAVAIEDDGTAVPGDADILILPYALEAAVVAVPADFPLSELASRQIKSLYSGRIANWRELGGPDLAVTRAGVAAGAPGERPFLRRVMGQSARAAEPVRPGDEILPGMIVYRRMEEAGALSRMPGIILFGPPSLAQAPNLKLLTVDGAAPTAENIRSGRYRLVLTRAICCRKSGGLLEFARRLPEFAVRREAQSNDFLPPGKPRETVAGRQGKGF